MKSGTRLGDFTVVRPLASGGMGSVYLATGPTGERVAIKTVDSGSASHLVGLRHEIRALLALDHPSIVRIVGHGLYEAMPWFAMEYIDGLPLRDHFTSSHETKLLDEDIETLVHAETLAAVTYRDAKGAWRSSLLPPDEQRILLLQMAKVLRGLGHLHAAGLVHRDLKPENIVVRQRSQDPVIVDFGIATQSAGSARERLSRVANIAGTPAYMAPEQTIGLWLDARADLYSVGCMIYEILSGRPPFVADSFVQYAAAHVYSTVPPLPASVSVDLANLVYRLLEKAPEDRPGYGHDVAREIERILGAERSDDAPPVYLCRPELVGREQPLKECKRVITALRKGQGGLTLITGPRGIGKTRFAIELSSMVESLRDVECVLVAHNPNLGDSEGQNPFTSVLSEIADRCRELGPEFTRVAFEGRVAVLAKVHPPILDLPGMEDVVPAPDLPMVSEAMLRTQAFLELMQRVFSGRPVALILDEFDPRYLRYLQMVRAEQNTRPTPLWIFMTVGSDLRLVVDGFARHQILTLEPLNHDLTQHLVRRALGLKVLPEALAGLVYDRSGGNPALAMELLRSAVEHGYLERNAQGKWLLSTRKDAPELPQDTDAGRLMLNRIETFPSASQSLIHYLAFANHPLNIPLIERLLGDTGALDEAIAPLIGCNAVEFRPNEVRIQGNQLQKAVHQRLSQTMRRQVHSDLARELRREPVVDLQVVAIHHREAGENELAQSAFLVAAHAARRRGDVATQWQNLRAYLDTKPPASDDLFTAYLDFLAHSQRLARTQEIRALSEEALAKAQAAGRIDICARIMTFQASQLGSSNIEASIQLMTQALKLVESIRDDDMRCRVLVSYGHFLLVAGRGAQAEPIFREARLLASSLDQGQATASAAMNHAAALLTMSRYEEAVEGLLDALKICQKNDLDELEAYVLGNLSIIYREHIENLPEALRLVREAVALHAACFDLPGEAHASMYEAGTLVMMRDFDEAVETAERAMKLNIVAETGDATLLKAQTVLGMALAGVGRIEEARTVFWEGRTHGGPNQERLYLALEAGAMERRLGDLDAAQEWLAWGAQNDDEWTLDDQTLILAARAHLALAHREAPIWPPPHAVKPARRVRGVERAIQSQDELWFGETPADAWDAMPSLAPESA